MLRQLRRRSLASLRREVEPVEQQAFARFLPAWHNIPAERRGIEAFVEALGVLSGAALVASTIEADVFPARVRGYSSSMLDELCTAGELVWVGAGGLGARDGRVRLCFADQLAHARSVVGAPRPARGRPARRRARPPVRRRARASGASCGRRPPGSSDAELLVALWDLVWAGEVTNDSFAPVRAVLGGASPQGRHGPRQGRLGGRPRPGRLNRIGPPAGQGRWSLVAPLLSPAPTPTEAAHAQALQLVERYGVVTREAVLAEGVVGGFSNVYGVLKVLEERGQVRRGYFVDGLGAAQFAVPGAVDRLRAERETPDPRIRPDDIPPPIVLAATDPAQPYGASLAWPHVARPPGPLGERAGGAPRR